jgi:hypothetical protein
MATSAEAKDGSPSLMSEERSGFTVRDGRHFQADGSARPDVVEERGPAPAQPATGETKPEVDFSSFIVSLAAQASALMLGGQAAGQGAAEAAPDLEGARQLISILEMLDDKTQGRRSTEESRLLEGLLFQLRMEYLRQSQRGGR